MKQLRYLIKTVKASATKFIDNLRAEITRYASECKQCYRYRLKVNMKFIVISPFPKGSGRIQIVYTVTVAADNHPSMMLMYSNNSASINHTMTWNYDWVYVIREKM